MKILVVKMSSMGDVIHAMPALMDAKENASNLSFHWLVEESFKELPKLHKNVSQVFAIKLRSWRKNWFNALKSGEPQRLIRALKKEQYDLIIDAQGLLKSALFAKLIKAPIHGLDKKSIREPLASFFYQQRYSVSKSLHAVERVRILFAKALSYDVPRSPPNYGLNPPSSLRAKRSNLGYTRNDDTAPYLVFLANTTWTTKLWPEVYWQTLCQLAVSNGYEVYLTSGNKEEYERTLRIKGGVEAVHALKRLSITEVIELLNGACGVVSVDTGFAQLVGALAKPNVSLFGPTNPKLSRPYGPNQASMHSTLSCAPCLKKKCPIEKEPSPLSPLCFKEIKPEAVWGKISHLMAP